MQKKHIEQYYNIMEITKKSNDYIIKLNNYEVLVFFEWLVKFVENNEIITFARYGKTRR